MLFNSWAFVWFFVAVWLLYLRLGHANQNRLLVVAGFVFYGSWDWRFLFLLMATTLVDFGCGLLMAQATGERRRRLLLTLAVGVNLASLGFFKYHDFFAESLVRLFASFGIALPIAPLGIVLPVGISFYTFQEISYLVDLYRRQVEPCRSLRDYTVYVAFFPQLVAGPIERASHLIRQVVQPRRLTWTSIGNGLWWVVTGYFLKVVVADNAAIVADAAFEKPDGTGSAALIGIYAFALQIYGDFAGYTAIARGTASLLGFEIMQNFLRPYFATSPSDFWRRWHISLSTWLRDYLYIPLGGNRHGPWRTYRNLLVTMLLGGLWHGAAWKFVAWGCYHGVLLSVFRAVGRDVATEGQRSWRHALSLPLRVVAMFQLTCIGWLLFRCNSLGQAFEFVRCIAVDFRWSEQAAHGAVIVASLAVPVLLLDVAAEVSSPIARVFARGSRGRLVHRCGVCLLRLLTSAVLLFLIWEVGVRQGAQFLYFQF